MDPSTDHKRVTTDCAPQHHMFVRCPFLLLLVYNYWAVFSCHPRTLSLSQTRARARARSMVLYCDLHSRVPFTARHCCRFVRRSWFRNSSSFFLVAFQPLPAIVIAIMALLIEICHRSPCKGIENQSSARARVRSRTPQVTSSRSAAAATGDRGCH